MMLLSRLSWVPVSVFVFIESTTRTMKMDATVVAVALIAAIPGTLVAWNAGQAARTAAKKAEEAAEKAAAAEKAGVAAQEESAASRQENDATRAEVKESRQQVTEIKLSIDGFMEKYSIARDAAARAGGVADERQAGLERAAEAAVATAVVTADKAATDQASAEQRQPVTEQLPPVEQLVDAAVSQALTDSNMERVAMETAKVAAATERVADAAESEDGDQKPNGGPR